MASRHIRQLAIFVRLLSLWPLAISYRLYHWQQSPGQQLPLPLQQLMPQQLPGQQFAVFEQQAAPVAARAESEKSDAANRANTFVFIVGFLSLDREKCACAP